MPLRLDQPPSDLPAPVAGTLVDEVASEREVVAALVDMADRALVDLTDVHNPQLVGSGTDVRINLRAGLDDARLRSYERALLGALFGPSPSVPSEVLLSSPSEASKRVMPYTVLSGCEVPKLFRVTMLSGGLVITCTA